jgi:hypothetical protein
VVEVCRAAGSRDRRSAPSLPQWVVCRQDPECEPRRNIPMHEWFAPKLLRISLACIWWPSSRLWVTEQFDLATKAALRVYPSGTNAASLMQISTTGISLCINGQRNEYYGYGWRFYTGPDIIDCKRLKQKTFKEMWIYNPPPCMYICMCICSSSCSDRG